MNIGKSITPIMPPKVETDKAFPRLLPKYLAIVVSPACPIAPCPKKRKLKIVKQLKNEKMKQKADLKKKSDDLAIRFVREDINVEKAKRITAMDNT